MRRVPRVLEDVQARPANSLEEPLLLAARGDPIPISPDDEGGHVDAGKQGIGTEPEDSGQGLLPDPEGRLQALANDGLQEVVGDGPMDRACDRVA
jgi:hypothetical protein